MNLINIVIAENEKESPWEPFSVRKGFKKNENIVSLFEGWGVLSAANWKAASWGKEMDYPKIIKDIFDQQGFLFGAAAILSPPIANFVKNAGYTTVEDFEKYLAPAPPQFPMAKMAPPAANPEAGAPAKSSCSQTENADEGFQHCHHRHRWNKQQLLQHWAACAICRASRSTSGGSSSLVVSH